MTTCDYLWLFVVVNEPTSDSEVYLHLCVVNISIWTACDAYCKLCVMHVMFIWVGYVIRDRTIKIEIYGRFAECYTRQRGILSSARVKTLSKENTWPKSVHSGTKMASMPSVCAVTLRKEANICTFWSSLYRVSSIWHSTKMTGLPSARDLTLGKPARFVRELTLGKGDRFAEC